MDCCQKNVDKNKKCVRKDGKEFSFPRRFSQEKCLKGPVKGFSMRSSCAPYKFCKKSKKNKMKGKGSANELPFLLKKIFSKKGVYEPGLVDKILTNIPKKSYAESIKYRKIQDQLKNKNKELEKIKEKLQKPEIISSNGPARSTRSASKKSQQSEYTTLNNRKNRIESEIDTLNLRLQLFEFYPYS